MSLSTDYSSPSCFGRSSKSATGNKSTDDEANGAVSAVLKGVSHHYYPSIDSYFDNIQHTQVHFDHVRRLEDDDICVTFLARMRLKPYCRQIRWTVRPMPVLGRKGFGTPTFLLWRNSTWWFIFSLFVWLLWYTFKVQGDTAAELCQTCQCSLLESILSLTTAITHIEQVAG